MKGAARIGPLVLAIVLLVSLPTGAQPPGSQRSPARMAEMRVRAAVPVEQILGFLAFEGKVGVTDEQLVKVRRELKAIYEKRTAFAKKIAQEMQDTEDRQVLMEKMRGLRGETEGLRGEMLDKLSAVLKEEQTKKLETYLQKMRRSGGRGGRDGRRPSGGNGGRR